MKPRLSLFVAAPNITFGDDNASTRWGTLSPTPPDIFLPERRANRWWARLVYCAPSEELRAWEPPHDTGWAMMSDVGSSRAGVPEALIQWRRARGEAQPAPMI